jgi:hypothetical protein
MAAAHSWKPELRVGRDPLLALAREAAEARLAPHQLEHELAWLACTDHGAGAEAGALALRRADGGLAGYVPLRRRALPIHLRVGEISLARVPMKATQLWGRVLVGDDEGDGLADAALAELGRLPFAYDLLTLEELPVDCAIFSGRALARAALDRGAAEELRGGAGALLGEDAQHPRAQDTEAREGRGAALAACPHEARGAVPLPAHRRGRGPQDVPLHAPQPARDVGQRRAPSQPGDLGRARLGARRFFYEILGYDPDLASHSPGLVLLVKLLEDLVATGEADILDFGAGDADYKRLFGTSSFEEVSMFLVRRRLYAQGAVRAERAFAWGTRRLGDALDRFGLKAKLKSMIRRGRIGG